MTAIFDVGTDDSLINVQYRFQQKNCLLRHIEPNVLAADLVIVQYNHWKIINKLFNGKRKTENEQWRVLLYVNISHE